MTLNIYIENREGTQTQQGNAATGAVYNATMPPSGKLRNCRVWERRKPKVNLQKFGERVRCFHNQYLLLFDAF